MNAVLAALVLLASLVYLNTVNDIALLAIPLLSLIWWKMKRANVQTYLALFFGFYLLLSALSLFGGLEQNYQFGTLAYVYFASAALVSVLQYLVEKNDS